MSVFQFLDSVSERFNVLLSDVFSEQKSVSRKAEWAGKVDERLLEYCLQNHLEITQDFLVNNADLGFAESHPCRGEYIHFVPNPHKELQEKKNFGRELLMF